MHYYKAIYLKNGVPTGKAYTFKSELELEQGDKVNLPNGKHGIIAGDGDMEVVKQYGEDKIGEIVGKIEESEDNKNG